LREEEGLGSFAHKVNESRIGLMAEDRMLRIAAEQRFSTDGEPLASGGSM
jgi:hypothetical protein